MFGSKNGDNESLSKKAKEALLSGEGKEIEYKESLASLERTDLVAFANSGKGGTILIGVEQTENDKGDDIGEVIGCNTGDQPKLKINNKAENCHPTIELKIEEEKQNNESFYRIEIPSGDKKPYCTSGGRYKIRGDACTETLTPDRLLSMFLEEESNTFLSRFSEATNDLEKKLDKINSKVDEELKSLLEDLDNTTARINAYLNEIDTQTKEAVDISSEANLNSDEALGMIEELKREMINLRSYIIEE